jgi:hypothetical protein
MTTTTVRDVSVFGDAMAYFDEAASLLNLEPGVRAILTHPSRQIIFSIPFQRDNGSLEVYTGYDVEVRGRRSAVRRRQGWRHVRSGRTLTG